MSFRPAALALLAVGLAACASATPPRPMALGSAVISYQDKQDLFYNFYEGPDPSGTAAAMYVSPRPVPAYVGHTYTTYQPFMPHEYLYRHTRSHYAHTPGAGWSRAKIRYRTYGLRLDDCVVDLSGPRY